MAQFTIYKSSDASAPVLTGQVNSLNEMLNAILVTGYGAQPAAGWTRPFSSGNKGAFLTGGSQLGWLRVDDNAPATAKEARITGYESMSDVDTGVNPFPTAAQGISGVAMQIIRKSTTADGTPRSWVVAADDRTVYGFIATGDVSGDYMSFMFGEIYSFQQNDNYRVMLIARRSENVATKSADSLGGGETNIGTAGSGHFIARGHTWLAGSVLCGKHGDAAKTPAVDGLILSGEVPYTNPEDGTVYLAPITVHDNVTVPSPSIRGRIRGLWQFCHVSTSVNDQDTINGTGALAGKTFLLIKNCYGPSTTAIVLAIETSNTLETN